LPFRTTPSTRVNTSSNILIPVPAAKARVVVAHLQFEWCSHDDTDTIFAPSISYAHAQSSA
jgi:hypothetical protein